MDNAKIYLCKADRSILGTLTGIKTDTCSLKKNATDYWEITFEVERFIEKNGILVQSDYYDSIDEMMKLYLDGNNQVFFVIDSEPVINGESYQETKTITAHSIECELNDIYLRNFKINCGTYDSQEYLSTDDEGNFNNIDDYTGLPKEYISLVNYDNHQLSLMHLALQGTDWTVKDDIDSDVCSIKKSFESSDSIYSFLMKTVSSAASVIFEFDRKYKQIGIVKAENFGEDTGIFVTMRNLMNSFEVTSSSQDSIITKLVPKGASDLGIEQVNFGKDYIINLDYFMNTLNEYGNYKFVSTELHNKYNTWKNYRETEKVIYNGKEYTRRELYIELTKLYNKAMLEISELHNRLPNDGCVIDYKTFSLEELKLSLNAYNKALVTLITLYKNEYGVTAIGDAPDYSPTPSTATNIKNTPYWYDFYAYKEKIIPQVEQSLKLYCKTDSNGNLMTDKDGNFIELEFGNPDYYADETIVKNIDDYLYEWSLYGLDELESKKKAWGESANVLYNECFIASGTPSSPVYRTADDNGWNSLTDSQKGGFTSKDAFISKLNQYLDYMSFDTSRNNSITNKIGKGIIRQCEDAITERKNEIASIEIQQNQYNSQRAEIANSVTLENFKVNGTLLFTEKELNIIKSMIRTQDYSNEYILTTNLDDIVTTVDKQEELYQDSVTKLYEISQPQYSFSTELDNLYYLEEFKSYKDSFEVGNFIRAGLEIHEDLYDNNFVKLRLISISYNPLESSEELSVEFSTMTKSLNGISDLAFLIDKESSGGSTSSGSSSSSSGGTYGDNDANVQISNNMLNALLKTEMFGTTVTDVILDSMKANKGNFNTLFAHSGVFSSLEAGRIKVSGDCLFDRIQSNNYTSGKTGSYLNLVDGTFEFAGGLLKYDVKNGLTIGGYVSDTDLSDVDTAITNMNNSLTNLSTGLANGTTTINGGCITTGNIKSLNWNGSSSNLIGNTTGSIICLSDGKFNFGGGSLKYDGTNLSAKGNITATTLTANSSGSIAGWSFNSTAFYKNSGTIGTADGFYIGKDGISIGNHFIVKTNGFVSHSINYKETTIAPRYFKNHFNYPYSYEEGTLVPKGDFIASYVLLFENNYTGKVFIKFKNPNKNYNEDDGTYDTYDSSTVYEYNVSNGKLILNVSKWFSDSVWFSIGGNPTYVHNTFRNHIFKTYPIESNPSIAYGDVDEIWSNVGIESVKAYSGGNATGTTTALMSYTNNPTTLSSGGMKIDTVNSNIIAKNSCLNSNSLTFYPLDGGISESNLDESKKNYITINANGLSASSYYFTYTVDKNNNKISVLNPYNYINLDTSILNAGISFNNPYLSTPVESYFGVKGIKNTTAYTKVSLSTKKRTLYVDSDGTISAASSSRRYKQDITTELDDYFNPYGIYDLPVSQFRYNKENGGGDNSALYLGFIAEDVAKYYPPAARWNKDHTEVDTWEISDMFPALVKLIQEQHKDIDNLKEEIKNLTEIISNSEAS